MHGLKRRIGTISKVRILKFVLLLLILWLLGFYIWENVHQKGWSNKGKCRQVLKNGCNKHTPSCLQCQEGRTGKDSWTVKGEDTPQCCKKYLIEIFFNTIQYLEENKLIYWIDFGTLLGSLRWGEMNAWDHDVDIGVLVPQSSNSENIKAQIKNISKVLSQKFEYVVRHVRKDIYHVNYSKSNRNHVDLFLYQISQTRGEPYIKAQYTAYVPYNYLLPLQKCKFFGKEVNCPHKATDYLKLYYGHGMKNLVLKDCAHCRRDLRNDTIRMFESVQQLHAEGYPSLFGIVDPPRSKN